MVSTTWSDPRLAWALSLGLSRWALGGPVAHPGAITPKQVQFLLSRETLGNLDPCATCCVHVDRPSGQPTTTILPAVAAVRRDDFARYVLSLAVQRLAFHLLFPAMQPPPRLLYRSTTPPGDLAPARTRASEAASLFRMAVPPPPPPPPSPLRLLSLLALALASLFSEPASLPSPAISLSPWPSPTDN
ncbi:hypothetical protein BHE74_00009843 [Ensete ventricosum]|nr:hypothetical protein BHE74_00009843 [Ensete ventricosum]